MGSRTALHSRAEEGDVEGIIPLVAQGANVSARDKSGMTPLFLAASHAHVAAMKVLVDLGADVDALDKIMRTPLHIVARCVEAVEVLLD